MKINISFLNRNFDMFYISSQKTKELVLGHDHCIHQIIYTIKTAKISQSYFNGVLPIIAASQLSIWPKYV